MNLRPGEYDAEDHGYVVLLEPGDNVWDLENVGLSRKDSGLLGAIPEYSEVHELDGKNYYQLLIIYNNSFAVGFYTAKGSHDLGVEAWLEIEAAL